MIRFLLACVFMLIFMLGCASVPLATPDQDVRAKSYATSADKANVYLYRNESMGGAVKMSVALDGKMAGQTGPKTYFLWHLAPGAHEIVSYAETDASLKLTLEAGRNYFVWQEVKMGLMSARCALHQTDQETGRKGVDECKLAQSNADEPAPIGSSSVSSAPSPAQARMRDVVYLKNGSIIKGTILEQVMGKNLKIQTRDESVFVYNLSDVEKITKEMNP
jgi:hypothetical protein